MDVEKENPGSSQTNIQSLDFTNINASSSSPSINYFINTNKILQSQCSILNDENSKLKSEVFKLNLNLNSKNDEIMILQSKLERSQKINDELNNKNKSLLDDVEKIQSQLSLLVQDSHNKINKISEMNNEKLNFENSIRNLKQEILDKENIIYKYTQEVKDLNLIQLNFKNQNLSLNNDLTNEKCLITSLNNEINNLRSHLTNLENTNNIEKNSLRLSINNLNDQILLNQENSINNEQRLNLKIHELSNENQSLKFQNENLELKISENFQNLELKDKKIDELSKIILELQRHIKKSESEIDLMRDLVKDKEIEIKNLHNVKRRLDEFTKIENSILRGEVISSNEINILKDEYKKLSALYIATSRDLDTAEKNNIVYRENLKDYEELKAQNEKLLNDFNKISGDYYHTLTKIEELEKNNSEFLRENDIMNEFATKMSMQNKNLLLQLKLGEANAYSNSRSLTLSSSLLQTNFSRQEYEEFIYKNIYDLESKFSEMSKNLILYRKDKEKLTEENESLIKNLHSKEMIIKVLENNINQLMETNKKIKNEYDTLKYYSESHYTLYTLSNPNIFGTRDENQEKHLLELNNKLSSYEAEIKAFLKEKEKVMNDYKIIETRNSSQANEILKLKNNLLDGEKHLITLKSDLEKQKVALCNYESLNTTLRNENESLKLRYEQIRSMSDSLFREKESVINSLKISTDSINNELITSRENMKIHMEKILKENENLKGIFNDVKNEILIIGNSRDSRDMQNDSNLDSDLNLSTLKRELNLIKEKFQNKDREFLKMKEYKTELDIKLENVLTENWTLKNQIEFLENRLKHYQTVSHKNIEIPTSICQDENINEIKISKIPIQNKILNPPNSDNTLSVLYEDYAKLLKTLENIKSENHILKQNLLDLKSLNESLVSNDISAPYKYLLNKIEDLNIKNVQLESNNHLLIKEKEKVYEDFGFLNLKSESIMQNSKLKDDMIIDLNEKIVVLQKEIEHTKQNLEAYSQHTLIIEEKENFIKKLIKEIDSLNEKINNNESLLKDRENTINQQLSSHSLLIESKNKEVVESKAKYFKMFYLAFKRAKAVIQVLNKLRETLEEKISDLVNNQNNNTNTSQNPDFIFINRKLKEYENSIFNVQEKLKNSEENYTINLSHLNKELNLYQEKEKTLINEIKSFKNINQMEGSIDMKSHFVKMLKSLTTAINIIKFKDSRLNILEAEKKDLQEKIQNLQSLQGGSLNMVDLTKSCEKCEFYLSEVNMLSKTNKDLLARITYEENEKNLINHKLTKSEIDNTILHREFKGISEFISSSSNPSQGNLPNESAKPQNKLFTSLLNQMRKATKLISLLEMHTKNIESKISI